MLEEILAASGTLWTIVVKLSELKEDQFWIGAGSVAQTVWNHFTGGDDRYGISDIDIAYYDGSDLSEKTEHDPEKNLFDTLNSSLIPLDVKNQARVHLWYETRFGYSIEPYRSLEDAIATWPELTPSRFLRSLGGRDSKQRYAVRCREAEWRRSQLLGSRFQESRKSFHRRLRQRNAENQQKGDSREELPTLALRI